MARTADPSPQRGEHSLTPAPFRPSRKDRTRLLPPPAHGLMDPTDLPVRTSKRAPRCPIDRQPTTRKPRGTTPTASTPG